MSTIANCGAVAIIASCVQGAPDSPERAPLAESRLVGYPPGAWRLTPQALADVVLTTSHILIRYQDADPEFSALRAPDWRVETRSTRSRSDALHLAQSIAKRAQLSPERFASIAQSYSEDLTTRDSGGSLGTWSAALMFPEFLDAIATMKVGQVSEVIETPMGFHVIALRRTPAEQLVSADEIVIGYAIVPLIRAFEGRSIGRSRREALDLATTVSRKARSDPASFGTLVRAHSEHESAKNGGDIGTWSTYDAFIYHREIEVIAGLEVGEVSAPVDSPIGFRIFRRKPQGPRAMSARKYQTNIPHPTDIDVDYMVRNAMSPEMAADYVAQLGRMIDSADTALGPSQSQSMRDMFVQLEIDMRNGDPEARMRGLNDFRNELKRTLGEEVFAAVQAQIRARIRAQVAPELVNGPPQ